jgi:general secretion pathway protein A
VVHVGNFTKELPVPRAFTSSPDPPLLYLTPNLQACITKCTYVIDERQGLTTILGDPGMGKSSVMRYLWTEYGFDRSDAVAAFIPTPKFNSDFAFIKALAAEFDVRSRRSLVELEHELRAKLLEFYEKGLNAVVLIDEAQNLKGPMLEQIRTLLNFEKNDTKLIQVVLAGQLELRDRLRDPSKKALRSRIFASSLLDPLTLDETSAMIAHRCAVAGEPNPFTSPEIVEAIYRATSGVPRDIVKVCRLAQKLAETFGNISVTVEMIDGAAIDTEVAV